MKKIGIVGVGCISGIYLQNITQVFDGIEVIGVCDLIRERAESAVRQYKRRAAGFSHAVLLGQRG